MNIEIEEINKIIEKERECLQKFCGQSDCQTKEFCQHTFARNILDDVKKEINKIKYCELCEEIDGKKVKAKFECPDCGSAYCEKDAEGNGMFCERCAPTLIKL